MICVIEWCYLDLACANYIKGSENVHIQKAGRGEHYLYNLKTAYAVVTHIYAYNLAYMSEEVT
jgi:hypothetical protein